MDKLILTEVNLSTCIINNNISAIIFDDCNFDCDLHEKIKDNICLKKVTFRNSNIKACDENIKVLLPTILNIEFYNCDLKNFNFDKVNLKKIETLRLFKCIIYNNDFINILSSDNLIKLYFGDINIYDENNNFYETIKINRLPEKLIEFSYVSSSEDYFIIGQTKLKHIEYFPESIERLYINKQDIEEFPKFPHRLTELYCFNNKLKKISYLPENLIEFNCDSNYLNEIYNLPIHLKEFSCKNNKLTKIPYLPDSLTRFDCRNNHIEEIHELPIFLKSFNCSRNKLKKIPFIPNNLEYLYCYDGITYDKVNYNYVNEVRSKQNEETPINYLK